MDGEPLLEQVYRLLCHIAGPRRAGYHYSDALILTYGLWAAMENKPLSWIAQTQRLPASLAAYARRPSHATLSRRMRSVEVFELLDQLLTLWMYGVAVLRSRIKVIDAMPLPVGFGSHDRTAKYGYGGGGKYRGYKLVAIIDAATLLIEDAIVIPINEDEPRAARQLIERMPSGLWLLADGVYDKNHLYDLAGSRGIQLLAPSKTSAKGLGHHRHSPHRLRAKAILQRPLGKRLMRKRGQIERAFGIMVTLHLGLTHLPAWIRGISRVGCWCQFKRVAITAARLQQLGLTPLMQ